MELGLLWQAIGESDDPYVVSQEPTSGTAVDPGTTVIGTTGVAGEGCGCKATNPIEWLLCNLWVLLPLFGLIIARMWWIRREIEVSFNGQAAVGLGNGPWNGFEVYSGDARMNLNPRAESVQIHRSFFRSARYEDARSSGTAGLKLPLRMDEEVALADGGRFTVGYGSGGSGPEDSGEFFGGQSASRSGAGGSSESPKELEW